MRNVVRYPWEEKFITQICEVGQEEEGPHEEEEEKVEKRCLEGVVVGLELAHQRIVWTEAEVDSVYKHDQRYRERRVPKLEGDDPPEVLQHQGNQQSDEDDELERVYVELVVSVVGLVLEMEVVPQQQEYALDEHVDQPLQHLLNVELEVVLSNEVLVFPVEIGLRERTSSRKTLEFPEVYQGIYEYSQEEVEPGQ